MSARKQRFNYVTCIGTPAERETKRYKTAAGAKQWCRAKLGDWIEWAARYNVALSETMQEVSKEIDGTNMESLEDRRPMWTFKDDHSEFTWVIEIWVEELEEA